MIPPEIIEALRNGLMYVCLWVLAALAVCALLLHVARRKQVRPVFAHIPPVPCAVLLAIMAVCTLFSGKNTNSPLAVTNDVSYTASYTIYVSCPNLGTGTITATFTPSGDDVEPLTDSVTFRCIEPLRKLVTTEKEGGRFVNPSRLVLGTNAVLKVSANGPFSSSEVDWQLVSGSADVVPNGWRATVTPTGIS